MAFGRYSSVVTIKEQLRARVEGMSEEHAAELLRLADSLDESLTDEEMASLEEARLEYRAGETVSLEDFEHEPA